MLQLYDNKYVEAVKGFSIEQMGRRRRDEYQAGVPRIGKTIGEKNYGYNTSDCKHI